MSENDFECFASTGVNAPGTMFPNRGSSPRRQVHFQSFARKYDQMALLEIARDPGAIPTRRANRLRIKNFLEGDLQFLRAAAKNTARENGSNNGNAT
jgi:alpha-D-ribose 1-methylphosphonate 5-triphosphate synthase subunit PhnI